MQSPRTYLLTFAACTVALLATVAAANAVVDPFGLFGWVARPGFNVHKAGQHGHDRMVKAYAIRRLRPDVLVLGTSRVQYGIDPTEASMAVLGRRPYNAGLLGSNIYLMLRYLQHAHRAAPLTAAIVGLDPLAFDDAPTDAARDFSEARMLAAPDGRPQLGLDAGDAAAVLLSYDALRLSLRTVRRQGDLITDLLPTGQRDPRALERFFGEAASTHAGVVATERTYLRDYARARLPRAGEASAAMDSLNALLAFAHQEHIRLELFFTPEHVRLHAVARLAGAQASVDGWRRQVAARVATAAAAPEAPPMHLWNMATLHERTCEPVPPESAGQAPMRWFWEATHARDRLGALVLQRMLLARPGPEAEGVGEPATPPALEEQIAAQHAALAAWEAAHPAEVAEIAAAAAQLGPAARR